MARKERTRLMDICDSEIYERTVRGSHTRNTRANGAAVSSGSCETADQSTVRACRVATTASLGAASTSRSPSTASCAGRLTSASSSRRTALRALISTRRSSSQADPRRGDRPSPRPRLLIQRQVEQLDGRSSTPTRSSRHMIRGTNGMPTVVIPATSASEQPAMIRTCWRREG